jgi:mannose-6-phosphate isomerase
MKPGVITFTPLFMERVWGGRGLQGTFGKPLLLDATIGEAWEVVDRPEAQSVVACGPLAGTELHELWREHREWIFGARAAGAGPRFPILVKLLDACDTVSVQVHPSTPLTDEFGGEPKSELWYIADTDPGAHLLAGLRRGATREGFSAALQAGDDVSSMLHRMEVAVGDALFVPAGRVHAIGPGCRIVEIQQNSDTTYRVYDFNRPGLDGRLRELHVSQSLASIDFSDIEPAPRPPGDGVVVASDFFTVTRRTLWQDAERLTAEGECAIVCVLTGEAACGAERFGPGSFFLVPAATGGDLPVAGPAEVLVTELPRARSTTP